MAGSREDTWYHTHSYYSAVNLKSGVVTIKSVLRAKLFIILSKIKYIALKLH